jgi:tetratricopeptide (TPR) repeat protein
MKKTLIFLTFLTFFLTLKNFYLNADSLQEFNPLDCEVVESQNKLFSFLYSDIDKINEARNHLIKGEIIDAIDDYRNLKDSEYWSDICPEYAFTLACAGNLESAMNYLDDAIEEMPSNSSPYYYAGLVFFIAGYKDVANNFFKVAEKFPGYHSQFAAKAAKIGISGIKCLKITPPPEKNVKKGLKSFVPPSQEAKDALSLALLYYSENKHLSAIYEFLKLIDEYAGWVLPYMGCSLAMEKAGAFDAAKDFTDVALSISGIDKETKNQLEDRKNTFNKMTPEDKTSWIEEKIKAENEDINFDNVFFISFGGANFSFDDGEFSFSISGRLGIILSKKLDVSLNSGYDKSNGFTLGFNTVYRYFFARSYSLNTGVALTYNSSSSSLFTGITGGASWYFDRKKSSVDVMLIINDDLLNDNSLSTNLFLGITRYF